MKTRTRTTIAMFAGAAAVALTAGFGGPGIGPVDDPSTMTVHPSQSAATNDPATPASNGSVHIATLTGCIAGANC